MKKLRYGLIGCGRISRKHIEALVENEIFFIPAACADPIVERAQSAAAKIEEIFPNYEVKAYSSYKKMIEKEKLDIAAVASVSGSHAQISMDLLDTGINVICEKPMALSTVECDNLINKVKETGLKMTINMQNRFNPPIMKLKKAIDANKFGCLYSGQISVRWNRNMDYYNQADWRCTWEHDGGALMNQCSHGIDLLQWMLGGKVKSAYGVLRKFASPREAEDFGTGIVEFENGIVGIIEGTVNTYPRNLEEKLSVFGEKGTVVIGGLAVNHVETWRFEDEEYQEERIDPPNVYGHGHALVYKDIYDSIINNRSPFVTVEDGKKAVEIILALYKSMKTGKRVNFPVDFSTSDMAGTF